MNTHCSVINNQDEHLWKDPFFAYILVLINVAASAVGTWTVGDGASGETVTYALGGNMYKCL